MSIRFRLLTEHDVKSVLGLDDLIEAMSSALAGFSGGQVEQPVRAVIPISGSHAFFATMPAFARQQPALGAKLVTVFGSNITKGLPSHLASILLLDPETGALRALLDGRYITEARTAAVSAVSSRLLAKPTAKSLAIIGSGVQARSHLAALSRVHALRSVTVWSPNKERREQCVADMKSEMAGAPADRSPNIAAVEHCGEATVGADIIVLVTSSTEPVLESGWVKPGAHVICVGACRPDQREIDPALTARARFFVDSRAAALIESGDVVMGIKEGRFGPDHIIAELGELAAGRASGRRSDQEITIFKSLGMAVEDVVAADLAYRRAVEKNLGQELEL
ncbi:MAG TPA: ornithine cyclodeaminase family protein [Vicinamibacterales bacterium]|jgi:ornithine cyclodeaminase